MKGYWCHACFSEKGEYIEMEGSSVRKQELEKKRNDEETEEGWVQCDVCQLWAHQICGLFNKGRNTEDTSYLCPMCLKHGELRHLLADPPSIWHLPVLRDGSLPPSPCMPLCVLPLQHLLAGCFCTVSRIACGRFCGAVVYWAPHALSVGCAPAAFLLCVHRQVIDMSRPACTRQLRLHAH